MRFLLLILSSLFLYSTLSAQIRPDSITIVRDQWGVPHIFAPTDAEVAYGFAWASAEDDFLTIQKMLLPTRGLMGLVFGKEGARLDVAMHILGGRELAEARYEKDLSPEFQAVLEAYADGLNAYAAAHPKEVLHRRAFPVSGKDMIASYVLGQSFMANVQKPLGNILNGKYTTEEAEQEWGSNAVAVSRKKTKEDKTFLLSNSHQPLEGPYSWYEAHLCSDEGWNILGATFVGGATIFLGTNPQLGWTHTLNYPDFTDVYALKMHPEKELHYRFDGQWLELQPHHFKARIKLLGFLPVGAKQKFYKSKYGVTFETPNGFFALRTTANQDIRAAEQWYRMNKARNFEEFRAALAMQAIPCTNIVYADHEGHIYYISNGLFPKRNPHYDWQGVLPGDTSATLWPQDYHPLDSLAQVIDPASGYVYNCNHTPFLSSAPADNPEPGRIPATHGYQAPDGLTNRAVRFDALIRQYDKLDYETFKRIKYDQAYHKPMPTIPGLELLFSLNPRKYPELSESIELLRRWGRVASADSEGASTALLAYYFLERKLGSTGLKQGDKLKEPLLVEAVRYAQEHLQQHFGKATVPLGELQRHSRGKVSLPMGGGPDVLAAIRSELQPDGRLRPVSGESYIQLVQFSEEGVEIESVNAYGASARPDSPHYTDQMELFTQQRLKKMTLDRATIFREAERVYQPGVD